MVRNFGNTYTLIAKIAKGKSRKSVRLVLSACSGVGAWAWESIPSFTIGDRPPVAHHEVGSFLKITISINRCAHAHQVDGPGQCRSQAVAHTRWKPALALPEK